VTASGGGTGTMSDAGTVAITGGLGFIGRHVIAALSRRNYRLRLLVRGISPMPTLPHGVELVMGDLDDPAALRRLVTGSGAILHMAGAIKTLKPADFRRINEAGTKRLIEACQTEPGTRTLLLLSSLAAREPELSPYADSKRAAELAVEASGISPAVMIRAPAIYGPGDRETLTVFKLAKRGWVPVAGRGAARLSLLHVEDLAEVIGSALARPPAPGIYEIDDGTEHGHSQAEIAYLAGEIVGRRTRLISVPRSIMTTAATLTQLRAAISGRAVIFSPGKVSEVWHQDWVVHERRLAAHLGFLAKFDLRSGFRQTVDWYRTHKWL